MLHLSHTRDPTVDNPFDRDHGRHEIRWHCDKPADAKATAWSLIAAHAEHFCYNYDFLVHFLRERNRTCGWGGDPNYFAPSPIPSVLDYLEILEFREEQLLRASLSTGCNWDWPSEWGNVQWNAPIVAGAWGRDGVRRWSVPLADLCELRLVETQRAITVQKQLMGHGSPAPWAGGIAGQQVAALFKIFFSSSLLQNRAQDNEYEIRCSLRVPPILKSFDPPAVTSSFSNRDGEECDTCRFLGHYRPYASNCDPWRFGQPQESEIWILERGIRRCSESAAIDRDALSRLVLAHELSHWLVHRFHDGSGDHWERESYESTESRVHESWAQLLALWLLADLDDKPALAAFAALLNHQSSTYRAFESVLVKTHDRDRVLATLPQIRGQPKGATFSAWLSVL